LGSQIDRGDIKLDRGNKKLDKGDKTLDTKEETNLGFKGNPPFLYPHCNNIAPDIPK
jgi:hypothetical protein